MEKQQGFTGISARLRYSSNPGGSKVKQLPVILPAASQARYSNS